MDTIVALSTAPGRSAIGVVRLSGPEALTIAKSIVGDQDLTMNAGEVVLRSLQPEGEDGVLDEALLTYFAAPNSYTGEDVLEISCHGSPVILRQVIDLSLKFGGRLAEPGEFTLRALGNGKLNLTEAIAIRDLINARTDAAAKQAVRQLKGELSVRMQRTKEELIRVIVILESALEFVEDDLPQFEKSNLRDHLVAIGSDLSHLAKTYDVGHLLREGFKVAIAGSPNVGKSSLFNELLRSDRAIVTEIPGTTRDSLTETISLGGFPVTFTDTAGVRESEDQIEQLGIERSRQAIADADLVLLVVDGSESPPANGTGELVEGVRSLLVRNKSDLPSFRPAPESEACKSTVDVSARTGAGVEKLRAAIIAHLGTAEAAESSLLITDARQYDLLCRASAEVASSARLIQEGHSEELIVIGLKNALAMIGQITGETTTEDLLTEIFSTFCIGK